MPTRKDKLRVLLVYMPFAPLRLPALGLSILKAIAQSMGLECKILYLNLNFAEALGEEKYLKIANGEPIPFSELFGEWLFKNCLYPGSPVSGDIKYYKSAASGIDAGDFRIRGRCATFLSDCTKQIVEYKPDVIGFSSIFQQNVSSLALAKRVKRRLPAAHILFGGGNCRGEMGRELMRRFPFIDAVATGEGERVFAELLRRLSAGQTPAGIPGLIARADLARRSPAPAPVSLDELPYPDYTDYFTQLKRLKLRRNFKARIPFETSRGCWWGEKRQCSFCAQNGPEIRHRKKSAPRALAEYRHLFGLYHGHPFIFVDNVPGMDYFRDFFPRLVREKLTANIYIQLRPQLTRRHFALLRDSGVTMIMAGLEGIQGNILNLMNKGLTPLGNILFLRDCKEYGITPAWNLLCGFPGETWGDYAQMIRAMPQLFHLQHPLSAGKIRIDRFSPHFNAPGSYGFSAVRANKAYSVVYPYGAKTLGRLAMYFESRQRRPVADWLMTTLQQMTRCWASKYPFAELVYFEDRGGVVVFDSRKHPEGRLHLLAGLEKSLFLLCRRVVSAEQLLAGAGPDCGVKQAKAALAALKNRGLLLEDEGQWLSPALPLEKCRFSADTRARISACLKAGGVRSPALRASPRPGNELSNSVFYR